MWARLKNLDAYSKTLEDFKIKTFSGATSKFNLERLTIINLLYVVTLISSVIILILFLSELTYYLTIDVSYLFIM